MHSYEQIMTNLQVSQRPVLEQFVTITCTPWLDLNTHVLYLHSNDKNGQT